jgi:hypothetical protein
MLLPHPNSSTRAAVFAAALLGGKVLPGIGPLSGALVAPAASAAQSELVGLARVGELLQALQSKQVGVRQHHVRFAVGWDLINSCVFRIGSGRQLLIKSSALCELQPSWC